MDLNAQLSSINLAEDLDEALLIKIGKEITEGFEEDLDSRQEWVEKTEEWMKLATQVKEEKNFPWPKAANVKFPLLTTAAMQFAARAYPALIPNNKLVKGLVLGRDENGEKQSAAERIGRHMSYQLLFEMPHWEEDMDKMCLILPIIGCAFKKTYHDPIKKYNVSELVLPKSLVINYYAKSVEDAYRKTHIIELDENKIYERKAHKVFLDIELGQPVDSDLTKKQQSDENTGVHSPALDESTPHTFIECHTFWDLDEDGYKEPYIITIHYETRKVVRIVARFSQKGVEMEGKKILCITPDEYFTKFGFIPNPDGSIYDLGFGLLLGGINESVNTLTNQLLDSGSLANMQAGFLGRGIRMRNGNTKFQLGEWKSVDFTGEDIKKHIFPLPANQPSEVLFKLLEALISSGKELASVAEIFTGKMPGQNTPATTTMATIEQGLKVFTAIYKRIYRSLGGEYQKLYKLNKSYIDEEVYFTLNDNSGSEESVVYSRDYSDNISVRPMADPNIVSEAQKLAKAQGLLELLQLGTINPMVVTRRVLEAQDQVGIQELMQMPEQQGPSPEQQKMGAEMQKLQQEGQQKAQEHEMKMQGMQMASMIKEQEAQLKQQQIMMENKMDAQAKALNLQLQEMKHLMELQQKDETHKQKMEHGGN
ncbi:MAG: hypothetical protein A3F67_10935 [Verrucomicrobia bacterium RIFCSPHIGHO2_12_FULL_41_10]|nr:MAG: hypothetical protein A3F67_10935 [Verrucomicrobia bacterium RIFCSPHIGHO2_12_FULL_41_10]